MTINAIRDKTSPYLVCATTEPTAILPTHCHQILQPQKTLAALGQLLSFLA